MIVRHTRPEDFPGIIETCREVYPEVAPWNPAQLRSHLEIFPRGQLVAVETPSGRVVGMAASLIVVWDDYERDQSWRDFTDRGWFTNHDPAGRTLYGAEVMVRPSMQGRGVGKQIYAARRRIVQELGLLRIRAGARLRGYHRHAGELSAEEYVRRVIRGELSDPTLTFQLREGFQVFEVVEDYLHHDPASLGWAALIEWLNPDLATPEDYSRRARRFHGAGGGGVGEGG